MPLRLISRLSCVLFIGWSPALVVAQQAAQVQGPTPLRPATMVVAQPLPSYVTEVRFVSLPTVKDDSLPDELKLVLQQLKPEQVKVIGGKQVEAGEDVVPNSMPQARATSLCLSLHPDQTRAFLDASRIF